MREILFKAKRMDNGEWIQGYLFLFWGKSYILWGMVNDSPDMIEVIPDTICQYTGLTDRAKNEVFENSIIKLISENVFGVVKFGEYKSPFDNAKTRHIGFYIDWKDDDRCKFWRKDLGYWLNIDTVVISNIFDNPELLKNE